MKRFAVGHYDLMDNVLSIEIVSAETWQEAVHKHSKFKDFDFDEAETDELDSWQELAFNCDTGLDCVEIP